MPISNLQKSTGIDHSKDSAFSSSAAAFADRVSSQYKGTDYQQLVESNPYLTYDYNPTIWDKIGNFFGFNTAEDKIRMQKEQASNEYLAQVQQLAFENEYNSPSHKAALMREAGLNPDLSGVSGVSDSSEFNQEQSSPDLSSVDEGRNVFSIVMNAVKAGFSLVEGFKELQSMISSVDSQNLDNLAKSIGVADSINQSLYGYDEDKFEISKDGFLIGSKTFPESNTVQVSNFGYLPLNKRNRRNINFALRRMYGSAESLSKYYASKDSAHKSRQSYLERSSSQFSGSLEQSDEVLREVMKPIIEWYDKNNFYSNVSSALSGEASSKYYQVVDPVTQAKAENAQNENALEYQERFSGAQQAAAENAMNKEQTSKSKFNSDLNIPLRSIVDNLAKSSKDGNIFAGAVLIALQTLLNNGSSVIGAMKPSVVQKSYNAR